MPFIITWGLRPHLAWLRQAPLSFASEPDRLAGLLELSGVSSTSDFQLLQECYVSRFYMGSEDLNLGPYTYVAN